MESPADYIAATPLHLATCSGKLLEIKVMMRRLVKDPRLINSRSKVVNSEGEESLQTPLQMAARAEHLRCMIFLLQREPGRRERADVNATFGKHAFNALALTKDSSCVNLLLLNGICPEYRPPEQLAAEHPRTLYVSLTCRCDNPLALAALLERDAATLDADFIGRRLANGNSHAVAEEAPLCIAASAGSVECVRLLLLHGADPRTVFEGADGARTLLQSCVQCVLSNCTDERSGGRILWLLHVFGTDLASVAVSTPKDADLRQRALLKRLEQLAATPLDDAGKRRLGLFQLHRPWCVYRRLVRDTVLKQLNERNVPLGRLERQKRHDELTDFLLFQNYNSNHS